MAAIRRIFFISSIQYRLSVQFFYAFLSQQILMRIKSLLLFYKNVYQINFKFCKENTKGRRRGGVAQYLRFIPLSAGGGTSEKETVEKNHLRNKNEHAISRPTKITKQLKSNIQRNKAEHQTIPHIRHTNLFYHIIKTIY